MALLTLAIIGGITLVVGAGAVVGAYYATEDDRARARITEIDQYLSNYDYIISTFEDLKTKLNNGKTYLNDAKRDFTNGGHVLDGVPLANSEFKSCITKINDAITNINDIINYYNSCKIELNNEKRELQKKL